jgi:hypothetical protein
MSTTQTDPTAIPDPSPAQAVVDANLKNILAFCSGAQGVSANTTLTVDQKVDVIVHDISRMIMNLVAGNAEAAAKDADLAFNILQILLANEDFEKCFGLPGGIWQLVKNAEEFVDSDALATLLRTKFAQDVADKLRSCC